MAKTRTILKHVRSVGGIRTVTNAMQTVASARFKLVHGRIQAFGPFGSQLAALVGDVLLRSASRELDHPLLRAPAGLKRDVLLVVTSNRGLCGSYNAAVLRVALERLRQLREADYDVLLHVVGSRGVRHLEFRGHRPDRVYGDLGDPPDYDAVAGLADAMMSDFLDGRISGLEAAYMQFVSSGRQRSAIAQLLPVPELPARTPEVDPELLLPYDFLPSPENIFRKLLPETVRLKLYQCFLDAAAAEQLMRRVAMRAATDNADDMIRELRLRANRLRQMQITTELSEIVGGRAGLGET